METYEILKKLEDDENSFFISIINSQKKPPDLFSSIIALDILPILYNILDEKGKVKNISLIIRSFGGSLEAPLPIVNLLREYSNKLTIFIPEEALSAATLIALAGNSIIMSPIGSLSPIDPQMKPSVKDNNQKMNMSVEDVSGYYELLDKLKIPENNKVKALEFITKDISPTILGQIERVRLLINRIANKILSNKELKGRKKKIIIKELTNKIGSHNYRICREEAKELGLPIKNESDEQHKLLKQLMQLYKTKLGEDESQVLIDFPEGSATVKKKYDRLFVETCDQTFTFESEYIFHKNGKIDKVINQWRKSR